MGKTSSVRISGLKVGKPDLMDMMEDLNMRLPPAFSQTSRLYEWLETDGLGGYASSTISGIHTRRYHGWLFTAKGEPGDRYLALSKIEDSVRIGDALYPLSSNQYPGTIHPEGYRHLWMFFKYPFPLWVFKLGKLFVEREIFMVNGSPGVFIRYGIRGRPNEGASCVLTARPLLNSRWYHHLNFEGRLNLSHETCTGGVVVFPYPGQANIAVVAGSGQFHPDPCWYRNMEYQEERDRGLDYLEDHYSPGTFVANLQKDVYIWAGPLTRGCRPEVALERVRQAQSLRLQEEIRRRKMIVGVHDARIAWLRLAADQFLVRAGDEYSIVAGYHWFGEWGRDTFISLPGILLTTGRLSEAKSVFARFLRHSVGGLVPNRFVEGQGAQHNSVDASLWLVKALVEFEKASGGWRSVLPFIPQVKQMAVEMMRGSLYGVGMSPCGLLHSGSEGTQVTWMDARVDGIPVTPRTGFPVEVNALWIGLLWNLSRWLTYTGDPDAYSYRQLAIKARRAFHREFIWPGVGLRDVVGGGDADCEIRPNQVLAAAIREVRLPVRCLQEVVDTALAHLFTPRGLRTLSPYSPKYIGKYQGGPSERDRAYHQGTAWPFLLGAFDDVLRAAKRDESFRAGIRGLTRDLVIGCASDLWRNPCLGSIYEVACGDPPFEPKGAVAQAWSVGEILRVLDRHRGRRTEKGGRFYGKSSPDVGLGISS